MTSWLLAYGNSFLRTDKLIFDYLTTRKDTRLWIGTIEAILALCFIRFRTGAKFRFKKGFKIGNDHSHPVKIGEYQFDFQAIKRCLLGGNSADLLNFKTPIFYSLEVLDKIRPEYKEQLLKIAYESAQSLLETYHKDIMAREAIQSIILIIKSMREDNKNYWQELKEYVYINPEYRESPLTNKNIELWIENIDILNRICVLYSQAYEDFIAGKNPEKILNDIKDLQETVRLHLEDYLMDIPKGH